MSVANILKTPIAAPAITIPYASSGGAPPLGIYLPLAGGTMDALPAGTITAHTIDGIASLTGIGPSAPGNTFVIQTDPVGDNILIDATPSAGSVDVQAQNMSITTNINTLVGVDVLGNVVIQPPPGYTYPDNPALSGNNVALQVKNWNNTTTPGNEVGLLVVNISSANGQADAIVLGSINAPAGIANGINISAVNGPDVNGIIMNSLTATQNCIGCYADNLNGDSVFGIQLNNMTGVNNAFGGLISGVQAPQRCRGLEINSVSGVLESRGAYLNGIGVGASVSTGVDIDGVNGVIAKGVRATNVAATTSRAIGFEAETISSTTGGAAGLNIDGVVGASGASGINISNVSTTNPASAAYGLLATKGASKNPNDAGVLMRLVTGNLGLAVQTLDNLNTIVYGDNGNLVVIGTPTPIGVTLNEPTGGWLPGHWFLFSKQGAGLHTLTSTGAGNVFNGVAGPFNFTGVANSMCLIFYTGPAPGSLVGWAAHVL